MFVQKQPPLFPSTVIKAECETGLELQITVRWVGDSAHVEMRRLNRAIKSAKRGVSWIIFAILKNQNVYEKSILLNLLSKH